MQAAFAARGFRPPGVGRVECVIDGLGRRKVFYGKEMWFPRRGGATQRRERFVILQPPPGARGECVRAFFRGLIAEGMASCRYATRPRDARATRVFPCFWKIVFSAGCQLIRGLRRRCFNVGGKTETEFRDDHVVAVAEDAGRTLGIARRPQDRGVRSPSPPDSQRLARTRTQRRPARSLTRRLIALNSGASADSSHSKRAPSMVVSVMPAAVMRRSAISPSTAKRQETASTGTKT